MRTQLTAAVGQLAGFRGGVDELKTVLADHISG
jgi:hypothetical protein